MPIDFSHAYANGLIYKRKCFFRLRAFFFRKFMKCLEKQKAQCAHSQFLHNCIIGENFYLGPNAWCENYGKKDDIVIGKNVYCRGLIRCFSRGKGKLVINDEVYIGDDSIISVENTVTIGHLTMISHGVHIFDSTGHPTDPDRRELDWKITMGQSKSARPVVSTKPIAIGNRVWVGFNSVILKGVTVGDDSIIGSGSVVVKDVEPGTIVAGNPAGVIKRL